MKKGRKKVILFLVLFHCIVYGRCVRIGDNIRKVCQKICGGYKRHTDESEDFMRITIFSLGGLLGQYVTNTALLHGAQVTAYVPDAKVIWPRKNLTVIEGSLQNRERVLEALLEADAVISVLTPMRVKHVKEEETPLADGNAMILSAMKQLGKTRFVTVGHVCIHAFGDCEDKYQRMSTKFMQIFWPGVYKDMQKMGQVLARSDLNWTLVRTCPGREGK